MKIETNESGEIVLKELFTGVLLETTEGNQIGICARDDTFEVNIMPKGSTANNWHRIDMSKAEIIDEKTMAPLLLDAMRYRLLRDEDNWGEDSGADCWAALGEAHGKEFDAIVDSRLKD